MNLKRGYVRMVETESAQSSDDDLEALAKSVLATGNSIPAGYTYFGQFVDHDISLDSLAAAHVAPNKPVTLENVHNLRSPFLNLETLYGDTFPVNNVMSRADLLQPGSKLLLRLDETSPLLIPRTFPNDLPRENGGPTAILVDARNDENLVVAQIHVAFIKFHNALAKRENFEDSEEGFARARRLVTLYYQWIVLNDYLPKVVSKKVLDEVLNHGSGLCTVNRENPNLPVEFTVGAFRAFHSMIRNEYNWNIIHNALPGEQHATLSELMRFTGGGMGFDGTLPTDWIVNWKWFFDIDGSQNDERFMFNFANPIDTSLSSNLRGGIQFSVSTALPALDLFRGRSFGLASGQDVARRFLGEDDVLEPKQIADLLPEKLKAVYAKETPLWFYLLAEAQIKESGQRMGHLGSRIISEVFVEILRNSDPSILTEDFSPADYLVNMDGEFGMSELLKFVAGGNPYELDPVGEYVREQKQKGELKG